MSEPVQVTLFADFASPFCFLVEAALERVGAATGLILHSKALELYPAPAPLPDAAELASDLARAEPLALELGILLQAPAVYPRTRKAHEAARFAALRGLGNAMRKAIYSAFWVQGLDIGRIDMLMELAERLGMDATDLKIALDIDQHRDEVLAEEDLGRRLGVVAVPTLYLGTGAGARILQGAWSLAALDEAVRSS